MVLPVLRKKIKPIFFKNESLRAILSPTTLAVDILSIEAILYHAYNTKLIVTLIDANGLKEERVCLYDRLDLATYLNGVSIQATEINAIITELNGKGYDFNSDDLELVADQLKAKVNSLGYIGQKTIGGSVDPEDCCPNSIKKAGAVAIRGKFDLSINGSHIGVTDTPDLFSVLADRNIQKIESFDLLRVTVGEVDQNATIPLVSMDIQIDDVTIDLMELMTAPDQNTYKLKLNQGVTSDGKEVMGLQTLTSAPRNIAFRFTPTNQNSFSELQMELSTNPTMTLDEEGFYRSVLAQDLPIEHYYWTYRDNHAVSGLYNAAGFSKFINGKFYVYGVVSTFSISVDKGLTWNTPFVFNGDIASKVQVYDIANNGNTIVVVGKRLNSDNELIFTSTDNGVTWNNTYTRIPLPNGDSIGIITKVVYYNGKFLAFSNTSLYTSIDGLTWTRLMYTTEFPEVVDFDTVYSPRKTLLVEGKLFVLYQAVYQNTTRIKLFKTTNGIIWEAHTIIPEGELKSSDLFYQNGALIISGLVSSTELGVSYRSLDHGLTWQRLYSPDYVAFFQITWVGTLNNKIIVGAVAAVDGSGTQRAIIVEFDNSMTVYDVKQTVVGTYGINENNTLIVGNKLYMCRLNNYGLSPVFYMMADDLSFPISVEPWWRSDTEPMLYFSLCHGAGIILGFGMLVNDVAKNAVMVREEDLIMPYPFSLINNSGTCQDIELMKTVNSEVAMAEPIGAVEETSFKLKICLAANGGEDVNPNPAPEPVPPETPVGEVEPTWVLVSRDGMPSDVQSAYSNIFFTGGRYFLLGGDVAMSTDTDNWESVIFNANGVDVMASNGAGLIIVAGKNRNTVNPLVYRSTDNGSTFTRIDIPAPTTEDQTGFNNLVYGNGIFVGTLADSGLRKKIGYSLDGGLTWTLIIPSSTLTFWSLIFANGSFYAGGIDSDGKGVVYKSTDGVSWTKVLTTGTYVFMNFREVLNGLKYLNGRLLFSSTREIFSSTDGGETWNTYAMETVTERLCTGFAYGKGIYVASTLEFQGGTGVYVSQDAINWQYISNNNVPDRSYNIIFGEDEFIIVGYDLVEKRISVSKDGISWKHIVPTSEYPITPGTQYAELLSIIYQAGQYLAVGNEGYNSYFNPTMLARGRWYNV